MIYEHKHKLIDFNVDQIRDLLSKIEKENRQGEISYSDLDQFIEPVVDNIKKSWPEDLLSDLKKKAQELSKGIALSSQTKLEAIKYICFNLLASRRSLIGASTIYEKRWASADLAMSLLLGAAPEHRLNSSSRVYKENSKLIRLKISSNPKRLIVDVAEIDSAKIYMYCFVDDLSLETRLIGWATSEDLTATKPICKQTNPEIASWNKPAYCIPMQNLRPMSQFLSAAKIMNAPHGIIIENTLMPNNLPVVRNDMLNILNTKSNAQEFDFLASCGIGI